MLKVAIILERADIGLGGAERSVAELTAELHRQGVAATILAAKGTPGDNGQILCADRPGKRVSLNTFEQAIADHLAQHRYDLIQSTLPLMLADIYQPRGGSYKEAMLQNIASYPFVGGRWLKRWTHGLNTRRTAYLKAEETLCQNSRATVAALSGYVKQQFQHHYRLSDSRIALIPNGIDPDMAVDRNEIDALEKTIHQSPAVPPGKTPVRFLFAANNPRLKGLRPLLYALRHTSQQTSVHPVLLVAGTKGLEGHHHLARRLGVQSQIVALGSLNGIASALSVCDVAILPSYYDPCSRFILEALAMGKPVITTRFNGASERYAHRRHGFIVDDPNDWRSLAEGIGCFCDRKKIELASNAIVADNLRQEVSIRRHVERLIALYDKRLTQRSPS